MKDCRECENFNGWDYSDGTPDCEYEGGYGNCPYNDESHVKKTGMKIEIDAGFMHDYILHTMKNTIETCATRIASEEIAGLITEELKKKVRDEIDQQVKSMVEKALEEFMQKEITIGGGWMEKERTITRTAYLAETIEKELGEKFRSDALKKYAVSAAKDAIDSYDRKLRDEVNAGVKQYFNAATREVLTENVVSMLMCNDTYKKLSDSMQTFLPVVPHK